MKRVYLFAAVAGLTLVSAAPPDRSDRTGGWAASSGYPPCSRTVTDRCIQLYERGIATRQNLAMNARLGPGRSPAMGGPYEAAPGRSWSGAPTRSETDYPPCSAKVTDRCIQLYERGVRRSRRGR